MEERMIPSAQARDPQTYALIGVAMEVFNQLGSGFLERVYSEALKLEFTDRNVPFIAEVELPIYYKGRVLPCVYRVDFLCFGEVLIEIKALSKLSGVERAQVINYLKATGLRKALLINFGGESLEFERFVL
jgi:GxxExxY protein